MAGLVEAARTGSTIEAQIIVGLLVSNGIDAIVSADDVGGLEPQLQFSGGVRVLVPAPTLAAAQALIADAQSAP